MCLADPRIRFGVAAEKGDPAAQYQLACHYHLGWTGQPRDAMLALRWFELSCRSGYPLAIHMMGELFERGVHWGYPIVPNVETAKAFYKVAAGRGEDNADKALIRVGTVRRGSTSAPPGVAMSGGAAGAAAASSASGPLSGAAAVAAAAANANAVTPETKWTKSQQYWDGSPPVAGKEADYAKAFTLLKLAAAGGHSEAQARLGGAYRLGVGTPVDYKEAARWFEEAIKTSSHEPLSLPYIRANYNLVSLLLSAPLPDLPLSNLA